ncbi:hypothetical protein Ciccas_010160 [Cichlidogyrus casuarinus]|uniref:Uncharacterized protein n=1 Tax=Cichlidogyrus casuarinus TaxID=1844966 RepID=A0ABD2PVN7_9PLAT
MVKIPVVTDATTKIVIKSISLTNRSNRSHKPEVWIEVLEDFFTNSVVLDEHRKLLYAYQSLEPRFQVKLASEYTKAKQAKDPFDYFGRRILPVLIGHTLLPKTVADSVRIKAQSGTIFMVSSIFKTGQYSGPKRTLHQPICKIHRRYGNQARSCRPPCSSAKRDRTENANPGKNPKV